MEDEDLVLKPYHPLCSPFPIHSILQFLLNQRSVFRLYAYSIPEHFNLVKLCFLYFFVYPKANNRTIWGNIVFIVVFSGILEETTETLIGNHY